MRYIVGLIGGGFAGAILGYIYGRYIKEDICCQPCEEGEPCPTCICKQPIYGALIGAGLGLGAAYLMK